MQLSFVMNMKKHRVHVLEFALVELVGPDVFPQCAAGALGRPGHERQFEHFDRREAPGRVAGQGPDHIGDTVAHLVDELRRRTAELHGRIDLALEPAAGFPGDLVAPRRNELGVSSGSRRQKVGYLQSHFLCQDRRPCRCQGDSGQKANTAARKPVLHVVSSLVGSI
jgi:hypothetical protein